MLQAVSANEGRTSRRMKVVLLLGGLAVLALPAVYLSRATVVRADDPKQKGAEAAVEKPAAREGESPLQPVAPETPRAVSARHLAEPGVEFLPEPSQGEKLLVAALDQKVTVDFVESPLQDVIRYLGEAVEPQLQIQIDQSALDDSGIATDVPVTCRIKDVRLRTALRLLLDDLGLTYVIRDEVMLITSKDRADVELITRTYPVGDLLELTRSAVLAPAAPAKGGGQFQIADKPATSGAAAKPAPQPPLETPVAAPVAGAEGQVPGSPATVSSAKTSKQRAQESKRSDRDPYDTLIEVITTTVKPQTWDEVGGPASISAVPVAQSLVISQTREVHDEILELLRALRAAKRAGAND